VTSTPPFTFFLTAKEPFNNLATGYTGTVQFTSTDAAASKPSPNAFKTADQGRHSFSITLNTLAPSQPDLTATDVASSFSGNASINVLPISGIARRVRVRVGQPFTQLPLANFSEDTAGTPAATIDWGDG